MVDRVNLASGLRKSEKAVNEAKNLFFVSQMIDTGQNTHVQISLNNFFLLRHYHFYLMTMMMHQHSAFSRYLFSIAPQFSRKFDMGHLVTICYP